MFPLIKLYLGHPSPRSAWLVCLTLFSLTSSTTCQIQSGVLIQCPGLVWSPLLHLKQPLGISHDLLCLLLTHRPLPYNIQPLTELDLLSHPKPGPEHTSFTAVPSPSSTCFLIPTKPFPTSRFSLCILFSLLPNPPCLSRHRTNKRSLYAQNSSQKYKQHERSSLYLFSKTYHTL